jgi:hypothetical protein
MAVPDPFVTLGIGIPRTNNHVLPDFILTRPPTSDIEIPRTNVYQFVPSPSSPLKNHSVEAPPPHLPALLSIPPHLVQLPPIPISGPPPPIPLRQTQSAPDQISPPGLGDDTDSKETSPTCSLNLVCYRAGRQGCVLEQIRVARPGFIPGTNNSHDGVTFIYHDAHVFRAVREAYTKKMCSVRRRYLSLKTLRQIRLLSV